MKKIRNVCFVVIGMMVLMANSCEKDKVNPTPDCGCDSPVLNPNDTTTYVGKLGYDAGKKQYVISFPPYLVPIRTHHFICADNAMKIKLESIWKINPDTGVNVKYWGAEKKMCNKDVPPNYGDIYRNFKIDKIETNQ